MGKTKLKNTFYYGRFKFRRKYLILKHANNNLAYNQEKQENHESV